MSGSLSGVASVSKVTFWLLVEVAGCGVPLEGLARGVMLVATDVCFFVCCTGEPVPSGQNRLVPVMTAMLHVVFNGGVSLPVSVETEWVAGVP